MKYLISACACLFFQYSFAGKVTGYISDTEGKALPFASVFIKGSDKGTNANSEGRYSFHLSPGNYTIICQHVGFRKEEKTISIGEEDLQLDFQLILQEMSLAEVILSNGEDPAYAIIRHTIKEREKHLEELDQYTCEVYTKGQLRLRDYPKKVFGQQVDFEDGDTSKQKVLYLSETISRYAVDRPRKEKIEVISSKVSGQTDGFGLSAPRFVSFYENTISIGENLNPRGFISPISEHALNYYRYKLEGSYWEDGREINHIKVIAKRKYEPLFNGYIDIVEDEWRIHSLRLELTKASQMELLDTIRLEQMYRLVEGGIGFPASQVIYPAIKFMGFDAYGSFINIYSAVNIKPAFTGQTFSNTLVRYTDSANKKTNAYWEQHRPVPLKQDEVNDYRKKDSLEIVRNDPAYLDSVDKARNKFSLSGLLLTGQHYSSTRKKTVLSIPPMIAQVYFNPAEGWLINTGIEWKKKLDSSRIGRKSISVSPVIRYGFSNKHVNAYLSTVYSFGKKHATAVYLSGGKRVFQFNNNSPIGQLGNTISCLLSEENRIKSYEAWYFRGSYRQELGNGFSWVMAFQYQDRMPLNNTTDYTWRDKENREYTPNYPNEIVNQNIQRHQVFTTVAAIRWQPGTKYIEFPDRVINIGSKLPVFSLEYTRAYDGFLGSDEDFSKWKFGITDEMSLKLRGSIRYRLGVGGFIDHSKVQLPDYDHFNGNISTLATEYLNSFQLLPIYEFSNTADFYSLAHFEYNLKGFLTNKIPLFRKLNFYLVTGANGFYINADKHYYEWFAGFDNIFKQIRVDFVQSYHNGKPWQHGFRIGFSRLGGKRGDDWP